MPLARVNPAAVFVSVTGASAAKAGSAAAMRTIRSVLRRIDDAPYKFSTFYPIVDNGKWAYHAKKNEISFTHNLPSPLGHSYEYTQKRSSSKKGSRCCCFITT